MNNEQKERLEQELRFLSESLEADVISKDEYEKGRERIERKLKEIEEKPEEPEQVKEEQKIKDTEKSEISGTTHRGFPTSEPKSSEEIEIKEIKEERRAVRREEYEEEDKKEEVEEEKKTEIDEEERFEKEEEKKVETEEKQYMSEEKKEEPKEEHIEEEKEGEEIAISKKWLYGMILLVIAVILIFSIRSCSKPTEEGGLFGEEVIGEVIPECSLDSDCKQEGVVGLCLNPGETEAKCEFREDVRVVLTVINDEGCELCSTSRMKGVIKEVFPNLGIKNLDYNSVESKELVNKFNIDALPSYIFGLSVTEAAHFNDFKSALIKKEDNYLVNNRASGANYYFKRKKIDNKLDVFLTADMEEGVDNNINEILDLFEDNINFTKHLVTQKQKIQLSEELGITSYPAFLINNQVKFGGFQSANSVKEKFCKLNEIDECKVELSKDIR